MQNSSEEDAAIGKLLALTKQMINLHKLDEAEKFLDEINKHKPADINVTFQRGMLYEKRNENEKALEQFMIVHKKLPHYADNLNNIAFVYSKLGRYRAAVSFYKKSLQQRPDEPNVVAGLATAFFRHYDLDESIQHFRRVLELSPDMDYVHNNILLAMIYAESVSPEMLAEEARLFGTYLAGLYPAQTDFVNSKIKGRKLRIGYVSADFRDHPIPYFVEPLFKNHNRDEFEVYVYSNTPVDNPIMDRIKISVDCWRDIRQMDADKIFSLIQSDAIDILVDIAGHTAYNQLKVFSKKPAPVQATWLGFPATTGVQAINYRITDFYAEPPGMTEHLNTEKLWRLPNIFCAYSPHENSPDIIDHPPFEDNGYITFGCFNNYIKVGNSVLIAWQKILERVPGSRLLLEIDGLDDPDFMKDVQKRLVEHKIPLGRVILESRKRSNQYVLYNRIDLALDPFPCVGGTTSMDTLWMGVPFVTLAGRHFLSRMGVSILHNAGLPELIANNVEDYIEMAVDLATNREKLKAIRHNLRERFLKSPAMDQKAFAMDIEDAFRGMWHAYCDGAK